MTIKTLNTKSVLVLSSALLVSALIPVSLLQAQAKAGSPLAKEAVLSTLTSKIDTKKAKVGDPVTAKTLNPLSLSDGSVLPAGSKLTGKVTQVQPKSSGTATLGFAFDQVEKKGGAPIAVHGLVEAIAPQPSMSDSGGSTNDLPMGSGGNKAQTAAMTGAGINGGTGSLPSIQPGSAIKGVTLTPAPTADGSSVLQSTDKDIKLDSGTRLEIGLTAAQ